MTTPIKDRLRERERAYRPCSAPGCPARVHRLSAYCPAHDDTNKRTGHPLGRTVLVRDLAPYRTRAARFISTHRNDDRLEKLLMVLSTVLEQTQRPAGTWRQGTRLAFWLTNLKEAEVSLVDILATIIGMFALREDDPRTFRSDRHFWHQTAIRVFRLAPGRVTRGGWVARTTVQVEAREDFAKLLLRSRFGVRCQHFGRVLLGQDTDPVEAAIARL